MFALQAIRIVARLAKNKVGDVLGCQLAKAGISIGANYRKTDRAESRNDSIHIGKTSKPHLS